MNGSFSESSLTAQFPYAFAQLGVAFGKLKNKNLAAPKFWAARQGTIISLGEAPDSPRAPLYINMPSSLPA